MLRADDEPIIIGKGSNVQVMHVVSKMMKFALQMLNFGFKVIKFAQDGCVLHIDPGNPLVIGDNVTIGHGAILHGCVIENDAMVAIGATVLTGARIGKGSIIGAGAVVMEGTQIPPYSVCFGVPAKVVRSREADGPGQFQFEEF